MCLVFGDIMEKIIYLIPIFFLASVITNVIEYFEERSAEKKFPRKEEEFDDSGIEWDNHSRA